MSAAHIEPKASRLLEADEVRDELRLSSTAAVYRLARERKIGGVVRMGRLVRFDPDGLREWIRGGGTQLEK